MTSYTAVLLPERSVRAERYQWEMNQNCLASLSNKSMRLKVYFSALFRLQQLHFLSIGTQLLEIYSTFLHLTCMQNSLVHDNSLKYLESCLVRRIFAVQSITSGHWKVKAGGVIYQECALPQKLSFWMILHFLLPKPSALADLRTLIYCPIQMDEGAAFFHTVLLSVWSSSLLLLLLNIRSYTSQRSQSSA